MDARLRCAGLALLVSCGCGLETSGIAGFDGAGDVEIVDDLGGDWTPAEDVGREDPGVREDVVGPEVDAEVDDDVPDDGELIPDGCSIELCNGLDDDCDGRPDDGFECAIGTVDICGPCGEGRRTCTDGCVWSECGYAAEVCPPGTIEACTPASCEVGHRSCESDCRWTACVADHSECTPGATQACSIPSCGNGSQACGPDCSWGACHYECGRSWETCCPGVGCVNLDSDIRNCGACGNDCGSWSICWFGDCS